MDGNSPLSFLFRSANIFFDRVMNSSRFPEFAAMTRKLFSKLWACEYCACSLYFSGFFILFLILWWGRILELGISCSLGGFRSPRAEFGIGGNRLLFCIVTKFFELSAILKSSYSLTLVSFCLEVDFFILPSWIIWTDFIDLSTSISF